MSDKPKLLCVDDEPGVLQALERVLREHFTFLTADSGETALLTLEKNPDVAIILSDYRMPGMNGVEFLRESKRLVPAAVRAILSGQIDVQNLMEAINKIEIHRFILKPWENEYLKLQMLEALQAHKVLVESGELRKLAVTDPVTGLTNHRYFQERLRELIALGKNGDKFFTLIMVDVDHFKSYNDRYGHPEGDRLLAGIADLLSQHISSQGSVSRYGGEEFAVLLPNTDLNQAKTVADSLRSRIENQIFSGPFGRRAYITVSLGLASFPSSAKTAEEMVSMADRALYQAKRQGRNQTVTATN